LREKIQWASLLILGSFLTATIYIDIKVSSGTLSSLGLAFLRLFWASVGILIFQLISKRSFAVELVDLLPLGLLGIFGQGIPVLLVIIATRMTDSAVSSLFTNTSPLWALLLCFFLKREKLSWVKVIGIMLGIVGIIFVLFFHANKSVLFSLSPTVTLGLIAAVGAAMGFASFNVFGGRFGKKYGALKVNLYSFFIATFFSLPFVAFFTGFSFEEFFSMHSLLVGMLAGVFATALPRIIQISALKHFSASVVTMFFLLVPPFATLFEILFFHSSFSIYFVFGGLLSLVGIYLTQWGKKA